MSNYNYELMLDVLADIQEIINTLNSVNDAVVEKGIYIGSLCEYGKKRKRRFVVLHMRTNNRGKVILEGWAILKNGDRGDSVIVKLDDAERVVTDIVRRVYGVF